MFIILFGEINIVLAVIGKWGPVAPVA